MEASKYPDMISYLLASVFCILFRVYFREEKRKKLFNSNPAEITICSKPQSPKIPTVTYWFSFPIPLVDGITTLLRLRKCGVEFFDECQNRFGKVYWLPFGHKRFLVINDVKMVQKLLSSKDPHHLNKPEIYTKIFVHWLTDGLINSKFNVWSSHRKILNRCFTYSCLQNFLQNMNRHGTDLIRNLRNHICRMDGNDQIVNTNIINQTIRNQITKIIADTIMGPSSLSGNTAVEFEKYFRTLQQSVLERLINPFIQFLPFRCFNSKVKNQNEAKQFMDTHLKNIINKQRSQYEKDMMSKPANDAELGIKQSRCIIQEMLFEGATNKEISDQVATFMVAGHESTYATLQMLMIHMTSNPIHQFRCRDEVDKLISQKMHFNEPDDLNFSMSDLANLKYLERCILESARITPAFPLILRAINTPFKIADALDLPSGTDIAIPVWMIHRDPDNFPNPLTFDPDRFLPESWKERNQYSYIPFSAGPRNCIGNKMALMEIKVIMAGILRNFEINSTDKLKNIKLLFELSLKPEQNYNLILKPR